MPRRLPPVHPGEILQEEFLTPLGLSQYRVAKATRVPPRRINEIVHGKRAVTADTALRLARYFGTTPEFWLNLQVHHDLERTRDRVGASIVAEVTPLCGAPSQGVSALRGAPSSSGRPRRVQFRRRRPGHA